MSDDQAAVTLHHRVTIAKYHGDRTPDDGEPDEVIEREWSEEAEQAGVWDSIPALTFIPRRGAGEPTQRQ